MKDLLSAQNSRGRSVGGTWELLEGKGRASVKKLRALRGSGFMPMAAAGE